MGTEEGASKLGEYVKSKYGQVDYAVSSIGAWWEGGAFLGSRACEVHNNAMIFELPCSMMAGCMRIQIFRSHA